MEQTHEERRKSLQRITTLDFYILIQSINNNYNLFVLYITEKYRAKKKAMPAEIVYNYLHLII